MIQIRCDRCECVLCATDSINKVGEHGSQYINFNIRVGDGNYVRRSLCRDCLYSFFEDFLREDTDYIFHDNEKEDEDNDTSRNT